MRIITFIMLLIASVTTHASVFKIIVSSDPNAPDLSQIIAESQISPSPPSYSLQAFNQAAPQTVDYLIKMRATGHLKDIMENSPNWSEAILQRYLIVVYPDNTNTQLISSSLSSDPYITYHYEVLEDDHSTLAVPPPKPSDIHMSKKDDTKTSITGINGNNYNSVWELSEGMGYVGIIDTGLEVKHPDLRAFDSEGNYEGGNLLDSLYRIDFAYSETGLIDLNVDELEPIPAVGSFANCVGTDGDPNNGLTVASFAGHGTHVTGLIAAKGNTAPGICKNCGISMMKYYGANLGGCYEVGGDFLTFIGNNSNAESNSMYQLANLGVGVVNFSAGQQFISATVCNTAPLIDRCLALKAMEERQILFVASAGNDSNNLKFPASDTRTVAAAGVDRNGNFWNESPNEGNHTNFDNKLNCPQYDPSLGLIPLSPGEECASNFSYPIAGHKTDVVNLARNVYSIFYTGEEHNPFIEQKCSDQFDGVPNDGYGLCTGTSMSAPLTSGLMQLVRSTIPLLPNGDENPNNLVGVINVLNASSNRFVANQQHDDYYGFGIPNPRIALETVLGKSNGVQIKTRLTPMFALYSNDHSNNVYTPFPQIATAFLINEYVEYLSDPSAPLVNEFTEFWYDESVINFPTEPVPRASFYVFTTNNNPFTGTKNMTPLRRMEKTINGNNRNDTYAITTAEIETLHADNYNYAGIEGYILPNCTQEPACIPTGAHKLYRVFDSVNFNHQLVNLPISTPAPANSTKLGYVYPNLHTDGDGLIDGQEYILGTSIHLEDTDGDTIPDGVEYPAAGVPYSDPMISDIIFKDGFE